MNKKEAVKSIRNKEILGLTTTYEDKRYNEGLITALSYIEQIDEPEKPVLSKEEAEWVDKLTDFYSLPDALYRITRSGYSHWFTFNFCGDTYELPIEEDTDYAELTIIKERLVDAVVYGYEVEKEKLYTVKFANEDFGKLYIGIHKETNTLRFGTLPLNNEKVKSWFTEDELKRFKFWDNPAFEVKEVKE